MHRDRQLVAGVFAAAELGDVEPAVHVEGHPVGAEAARQLHPDLETEPGKDEGAVQRHLDVTRPLKEQGGVLAVVLGWSVSCAGPSPSGAAGVKASYSKSTGRLELITYDTNRDGKVDAWSRMDGTRLVRMDIDKDFDGIVDRWEYYTSDGALEKVGFSRQRDGKVDAWAFQGQDGQVSRIEIATRRDEVVRRWEMYEKGALVRAEEDTDGDGRVDKWEQYAAGALASVSLDTRKSGVPDRRLIYGPNGVKVERLGAPASAPPELRRGKRD